MKKEQLTLVKIGGAIIDDQERLYTFLQAFASLEGPKILVHGGGKLATELAVQLHIPQQMIDGRRVTDEATLRVVTMVYAGYINKNIVALLQSMGCNAVGLSGADGDLVRCRKRINAAHDYGFAGDIDQVQVQPVSVLLQQNYSPVIAPITHDGKGQLLNTNADTIAGALAVAMSELFSVHLIYCFEKAGVLMDAMDGQSVIGEITPQRLMALKEQDIVHSGMLPKLDNAFSAVENGVSSVSIGNADDLHGLADFTKGTRILKQ